MFIMYLDSVNIFWHGLQVTYRIDFKTMKESEVGKVGSEVEVRRKAAGKGRLAGFLKLF